MKIKYSLFTILFILYSCGEVENGVDGLSVLVNSEEEPVGDNCSTGGTKLTFGNDIDGDGTLDDDEITNTVYVCNGTNGDDGLDGKDNAEEFYPFSANDAYMKLISQYTSAFLSLSEAT